MISQKLLVVCIVFAAAMLTAGVASAAAPAYCALYAREYATGTVQPTAAAGMLQSVQDQAYYRCLNQDENPALPSTSAYLGVDITKPLPTASAAAAAAATAAAILPPPAAAQAPTAAPSPKPAAVVKASTPRASAPVSAPYRGSGLTPWTPEWAAWCAKSFPNSWDAKSGTVLRFDSGSRELCK